MSGSEVASDDFVDADTDGSNNAGGSTTGDAADQVNEPAVAETSAPPPVPTGTGGTPVTSPPAANTRAKKRNDNTPFVALTQFSGREMARRRGNAAVQLNYIRGLLNTVEGVVDAVAAMNANPSLSDEEIQHDLQEMDQLRQEIVDFPINSLESSWRNTILREVTQGEAKLTTAAAMLQKRQGNSNTNTASSGTASDQDDSRQPGSPRGTPAATGNVRGKTTRTRGKKGTTTPRRRALSVSSAPTGGTTGRAPRASSARGRPPAATRDAATGRSQTGPSHSLSSAENNSATSNPPPTQQPATPAPPNVNSNSNCAPAQHRLLNMAYGSTPDLRVGHSAGVTNAATLSASVPNHCQFPPDMFTRPPPSQNLLATGMNTLARPSVQTTLPPPQPAWTAPSWQGNPHQPYTPNACELGSEFYLSFPYPWNSLPSGGDSNITNILKIGTQTLPKFTGDRRTYITWRNSFIPGVHLKAIDVSYKILLLRGCMVPSNRRMKEFIDSIVGTPEGYRQAVVTLEDRYGGAAALLMTRQEALLALPEVREGELELLETLHTRLGTFLLEWEGIVGTSLTERESMAYYLALMAKVEHNYSRKFLEWVENRQKRENLSTLHEWLTGELKRHRRVEVYAMQKAPKTTHRPAGETSRPPRTGTAPSIMDRNFQRPRGFLAQEEAMVEDELESPDSQQTPDNEDPEHACLVAPPTRAPRPPCTLCGGDHGLGRCDKFKTLAPAERKELLIKENRCFLCFQRGHSVARCRFTFKCVKCGRKHHTLLHGADATAASTFFTMEEEEDDYEGATTSLEYGLLSKGRDVVPPTTSEAEQEQGELNPQLQGADPPRVNSYPRVSLRTLPVLIENPINGEILLTNAMLDDGCTASVLLGRELASRLGLKGQVRWTSTEGVGGHVTKYQTVFTCVKVSNPSTRQGYTIPAQVMDRPAGTYQPVNWKKHKEYFSHLRFLPLPEPISDVGVEVMIGNQFPVFMASQEEVVGTEADPVARRTCLGWTVVGPSLPGQALEKVRAQLAMLRRGLPQTDDIPPPLPEGQLVSWDACEPNQILLAAEASDKQLVRLLQRMLDVEEPGEAVLLSPREEYIVKQAKATLLLDGKRYQVGCTWAPGGSRPPLARGHAENRLLGLEKGKYFKNPKLREAYQAVIALWEREGFVKEVALDSPQVKHLLPHFPVLKESATTPVRPVMDCSTELNKHLLSGPNLLNEVTEVLLRFRSGLYSFSGDVKQMFLRIHLPPEDRPYHCFLWRKEAGQPIIAYQFQVHVFGNAGSPFLAVFVVREHAKKYKEQFPKAMETLLHSTLIDDVLDSADTVAEAKQTLENIKTILAHAGMELTKSHSNSPAILSSLAPSEIATGLLDVSAACNKEPTLAQLKALGLNYDPKADEFAFALRLEKTPDVWTKRGVLKVFPRLFDPLGLILPFAMVARIFFSMIARKEYAWDAPLSEVHARHWKNWLAQAPTLEKFRLRRCPKQEIPAHAQLHIFADASASAYAAVAYLKCEYTSTAPSSHLICARAHVAPVGKISVPRLELLAAELAVRVRDQVIRHLKVHIEKVFHWTDSTTVLCWLHNDKNRLQLFVHNKVKKIHHGSNLTEWHWTPTHKNPADIPSRGCSAEHLCNNQLWLHGPEFLHGLEDWPRLPLLLHTPAVLAEMKKEEQILLSVQQSQPELVLVWERFSSWKRLLLTIQKIMIWRDKTRQRLRLPTLGDTYLRAEQALLRQAQRDFHPPSLPTAHHFWTKMGFQRLIPFQDERGLWRGEGRLRAHAHLPHDVREPLLLPRQHHVATLLLRYFHERILQHSGGVNHLLARFHGRFWMPAARACAYTLLTQCIRCKRQRALPRRPPEGQLPHFRLPPLDNKADSVAFNVIAVDCAGPFRVKRGRSYEAHYMLLITCCQIRAVRIEHLTDLSVDAFLLALTRSTARGVRPHTVLSDNGGNFDGANRLLRQLWLALPQEELERRQPQIKWKFNPPYASHYGGVFERLIKAAKEALYHVLPSTTNLNLEELVTAFAVVEGVLNSRPLAYTSIDGLDLSPITPNHFLYGTASEPFLMFDANASIAKRWSTLQEMIRIFLRRFHQEVRPHLQLTHTHRGGGRDLKEGDVVVFFMPSANKMWPLARITRTFPGPDGRVRTVELLLPQIKSGNDYSRHPDKLFRRDVGSVALLLPLEAQQPLPSF